ncbi:MAG TPA: TetR/AcrR family transcriptional regulator [Ignavibacteria bacterium]|nr:TetR/AcrR family transcriptional regulator [Ignavibacteria bacterium]HMR40977.1 TetR/AcrR family transcriptional regulator [Ignavibacteria bacterium]
MKSIILEKILTSSLEHFVKKGIREISVHDIVKSANISTRTFYRYFRSKEMVIDYIITSGIKKNKLALQMVANEIKNPVDAYVIFISTTYPGLKNMSNQFFTDLVKYFPKQFAQLNNFVFKDITAFYIDNIRKGKKMGLYRKEINENLCAFYIVESVFNSIYKLFLNSKKFSKEFVYLEIRRMLSYGILTRKGIKKFNESSKNYFPELTDMKMPVNQIPAKK